jgi:membrane-bound metal-dependent hydrolase YbcI (DUF457 family)
MYAAHFAAGLAIKGRIPRTPTWALMTAIFLPDFFWIVLAWMGIEPTQPPLGFFDDWSHSLVMVLVWSSLFACFFWRRGWPVVLALAIAGISHFILDFLIHPAKLALYPHSSVHLGWDLWQFGLTKSWLGANRYWWYEACVLLVLILLYAWFSWKSRLSPNLVAASCILVIGLHLMAVL